MLGNNTAWLADVAFSPNGKLLATVGVRGTRIWDLATRRRIATFGSGTWDVAFSPNGERLAVGDQGISTQIFYVPDLKRPPAQLGGHRTAPDISANVFGVAFSPNGEQLATAAGDRTVLLWDMAGNGFHLPPLTGHTHSIRDVDFSPDGRFLVTSSEDGTIRRWDAETGREVGQLRDASSSSLGSAVAWSPAGNVLAATDAGGVRLWDLSTPDTSVML
jgi:WD40 repeat protein